MKNDLGGLAPKTNMIKTLTHLNFETYNTFGNHPGELESEPAGGTDGATAESPDQWEGVSQVSSAGAVGGD